MHLFGQILLGILALVLGLSIVIGVAATNLFVLFQISKMTRIRFELLSACVSILGLVGILGGEKYHERWLIFAALFLLAPLIAMFIALYVLLPWRLVVFIHSKLSGRQKATGS